MGTVDLNDLGVFVTVVETASFSRAASRLGLPKSSVSRAIARLEAATKITVLHRTTRKVSLSTAGRALYENVRTQVSSLRQAADDLPELSEEPSGRLRVTAVVDSSEFFADVVARFVGRHPSVQVELRLTNEFVDLVAEGIDLALRFSTRGLKDSTLNARKLSPASLQIYASPSYIARRGMPRTPRDLDQHEWVVHRSAVTVRLEGGTPPTTITTRGRIECNGFAFLRAALERGCGLGFLDASEAGGRVASGKLVRVLPRWSCPISNLWAVWPGARQPPRKVSAFLDVVIEALGTHPFAPSPSAQ
ncbi:MAG TPA: LysR family transcriptional regulator [Polyangia bacterium]|nr:LysR family transcriptional regulator [Polyangia bacterium]